MRSRASLRASMLQWMSETIPRRIGGRLARGWFTVHGLRFRVNASTLVRRKAFVRIRRRGWIASATGFTRFTGFHASFDGDRLREVAGLVDVAAAQAGDVVGEELQR